MSFNINFFGVIPFNSDNLPEDKIIVGQGTSRPLGFTLSEMCKLYWGVRSFKVNISESFLGNDALSDFISAGGTSGGIIGASAGLNAVNQNSNNTSATIQGYTKVTVNRQKKIRVQPDQIHDGQMVTSIQLSKEINPNILISHNLDVNEGQLAGAGPIHSYHSGGGGCTIDFSDIVRSKGLFWPTILITIGILSSQDNGGNNASVLGQVSFVNFGEISFYGFSTATNPLYSVGGAIQIGDRCSDRFYWDGFDNIRGGKAPLCPTWNAPLYQTIPVSS